MTKDEALKLALEALEELWGLGFRTIASKQQDAITAIREALAEQPAQQDYWQEEAQRYAQNAEFWRGKYESATAQQQEPICKLFGTLPVYDRPTQQQEPYGQVTVVRRPGCVDQHWFYRWPEPPYLDNAVECHTVYTSPPASKPWVGLTLKETTDIELSLRQYHNGDSYDLSLSDYARAIEAKLREKNA